MKTGIRFLILKFKRRTAAVSFDDHLLRDIGLSRVVMEFAGI
jgi:hypothetical protein